MNNFRRWADVLEADVTNGRLQPGDRLPTQREFADRHRIAVSTATRVYTELIRRGLAVGEVGRGTFVRTGRPTTEFATGQGIGDRLNLATNAPVLPDQAVLLTAAAAPLTRRPTVIASAMETVVPTGTPPARRAVARFVAHDGWRPEPDAVVFTGNGRQALAAAIAALVPPGHRLGVEALSYQSVAGIAARLGVEVVALPLDDAGLRVDGLALAHRRHRLHALYVQPTLHNPLGITMTAARRRQLAAALRSLDLAAIEDRVYAFLIDDPLPIASLAPDHVVMVDSLSKRVAPGLTLGWSVAPHWLVPGLVDAIRASALTPSGLGLELGVRLIVDGTVDHLVRMKRRDAIARQRLLRQRCTAMTVRSDPRSYHAWVKLSGAWRAESFTAAAAERGIAIAPAKAFTIGRGHSPNAVRLALASPSRRALAEGLTVLNELAKQNPNVHTVE